MSTALRNDASAPTVHRDRFGRFHVITPGAAWSTDPPTVREVHEAHARELQREAMAWAVHEVIAWLRRAIQSRGRASPFLHHS